MPDKPVTAAPAEEPQEPQEPQDTPTAENRMAKRVEERFTGAQALEKLIVRDGALVVTPELSAKFNVLAPMAVLRQQSELFKPGMTIVQLDPVTDFYVQDKQERKDAVGRVMAEGGQELVDLYDRIAAAANNGKGLGTGKWPASLSILKVGLRKLSGAGAVRFGLPGEGGKDGEYVDVTLTYKEHSKVVRARPFYYVAVGGARRADGTVEVYRGESEWDPYMAAIQLETSIGARTWRDYGDAKRFADIVSGFTDAHAKRRPMAKSKAQNMVVRDAMKIQSKYTVEEARKPFFIVSYDFTPEQSAAGAALMASMYGVDNATDAVFGGEPATETIDVADTGLSVDADLPDSDLSEPDITDVPCEEATEPTAPEVPPTVFPEDAGGFGMPPEQLADEGEAAVEAEVVEELTEADIDELNALNGYVLPGTSDAGKTLGDVWKAKGRAWFDEAEVYVTNAKAEKAMPIPKAVMPMFDKILRYKELRVKAGGA